MNRRNVKVLILNAGVDLQTLLDNGVPWRKRASGVDLGISYDFNLGGLPFSTTTGVLEINLRVNLSRDKKNRCDTTLGKFEIYNGKCPKRF